MVLLDPAPWPRAPPAGEPWPGAAAAVERAKHIWRFDDDPPEQWVTRRHTWFGREVLAPRPLDATGKVGALRAKVLELHTEAERLTLDVTGRGRRWRCSPVALLTMNPRLPQLTVLAGARPSGANPLRKPETLEPHLRELRLLRGMLRPAVKPASVMERIQSRA